MRKAFILLTSITALFSRALFASPLQIDYYGVVSTSLDQNMMKMAQDMFFTQLKSIDNLNISDKRPDISHAASALPDTSSTPATKVIFWAEILEERLNTDSVNWNCSFRLKTPADGRIYSRSETYDSYYKILVNAKSALEELIDPLKQKAIASSQADEAASFIPGSASTFSLESLSGTWAGEPYADKIVILRGGRGFIIYKNGATMNITVALDGQKIKVKQAGKPNASFYPDLSRETALSAAVNASPIEWNFTINPDFTLSGTKKTLVKSNSTPETAQVGSLNITWTKK